MDSFSADVNVYMRRHKSALFRTQFPLAVNYRLFSHGDVSYRFNGKNDNVVLEYKIRHETPTPNNMSKNYTKTMALERSVFSYRRA